MSDPALVTAEVCQSCGKAIPALPIADALCVECRYSKSGSWRPWQESGEFEVELEHRATPEPPISLAEGLVERLIELGTVFAPGSGQKVLEAVESALDRAGDARGAEALAHIAGKLDGTAAGTALRRVLMGDRTPLRAAADKTGFSYVALWKQEKTIRKHLGLTPAPLV